MNKLREIRIKKGLSVKDASAKIGISAPYLSQLETGERQIGRNTLDKICKAYNIKPNDVLDYDDFIFIDESNREFREIDIKLLNILKALDESDRAELENFISFLIYKHQKRIEDIENGSKKGN